MSGKQGQMFYIRYPRLCPLLAPGAASSVAAATNLASIPRPFLRFLHRECASCEYDVHTMYFAGAFDQWRVTSRKAHEETSKNNVLTCRTY